MRIGRGSCYSRPEHRSAETANHAGRRRRLQCSGWPFGRQGFDRRAGRHPSAEHLLDLVVAGEWEASYNATAAAFRKANTLKLWSDTAQQVHGELGTVKSREFLGLDDVPSPQGLTVVKFRTDYANRAGVIETLSLVHEDGSWKIAGIYVS